MKADYNQFDVVLVDFGNEQSRSVQCGIRPAIIIQNNLGNHYGTTTIVMPVTSQIKKVNQPTHTLIKAGEENGLTVDSMVLAEAIKQISKLRIKKYIGHIADEEDRKNIFNAYMANFLGRC